MLAEPDLDHRALAAALAEHHGLAPRTLRFVPAGETAWCYRLTDDRGGRWFLKLARPGAIDPARAEFALELAGALAALGLPVPRPRPTRSGRRWCRLDGLRMACSSSSTATARWPGPGRTGHGQAGRVADRGHPRRHPGAGPCSPCWSACRPWEPMPAHGLGSGCCATATSSPTTSWWTGPAGLDPDLVAFFLLRRNLDDLADWLGAALEADRPDPQRRADLDGVRWCLSRRPELEARIDHTRRLLAQRRRIS